MVLRHSRPKFVGTPPVRLVRVAEAEGAEGADEERVPPTLGGVVISVSSAPGWLQR